MNILLAMVIVVVWLSASLYCVFVDHECKKERQRKIEDAKKQAKKTAHPMKTYAFSANGDQFAVRARSEKQAWEKVRRITEDKGGPVLRIINK